MVASLRPKYRSSDHQTNSTNATYAIGTEQNPALETTKDNQKPSAARVALLYGEGKSSSDLLILL